MQDFNFDKIRELYFFFIIILNVKLVKALFCNGIYVHLSKNKCNFIVLVAVAAQLATSR